MNCHVFKFPAGTGKLITKVVTECFKLAAAEEACVPGLGVYSRSPRGPYHNRCSSHLAGQATTLFAPPPRSGGCRRVKCFTGKSAVPPSKPTKLSVVVSLVTSTWPCRPSRYEFMYCVRVPGSLLMVTACIWIITVAPGNWARHVYQAGCQSVLRVFSIFTV